MTDPTEGGRTFRGIMLLMAASSFIVPLAGLVTAPILAQALGVEGRGIVAAALAPAALAVTLATLGLPEALTYYLAKHPRITRPAISWAALIAGLMGVLCLVAVLPLLPFLSAGEPELAELILLATALVIPALVVNVLRGSAAGRQMWRAIAVERVVNGVLRITLLGGLFLLGELTVLAAVLVTSLSPVIAGFVYWRLWLPVHEEDPHGAFEGRMVPTLLAFGSKMWIGAVASMVLGRISQIIMAPLSDVAELGIFVVAITIADVPLIVASTIQGTLYGVNSRSLGPEQVTATSRLTLIVGAAGCLALGATLPFWIGPVFGEGFEAAIVPTWLLLLASVILIPGLMAGAGLGAWGRPGLRSLALVITLCVNVTVFVWLVPQLGATGAAIAGVVGNVVLTGVNVIMASKVMHVALRDFVIIRPSDVSRVGAELMRLIKRNRD